MVTSASASSSSAAAVAGAVVASTSITSFVVEEEALEEEEEDEDEDGATSSIKFEVKSTVSLLAVSPLVVPDSGIDERREGVAEDIEEGEGETEDF
jgi:hypothetical protein